MRLCDFAFHFFRQDFLNNTTVQPIFEFTSVYLEKYFNLNGSQISYQIIPSVRGFKKYALLGYGYGLVPTIDIVEELKKKQLINLFRNKTWKVPLYWHHWAIESKFYQNFNEKIIRYTKKKLKPFQ